MSQWILQKSNCINVTNLDILEVEEQKDIETPQSKIVSVSKNVDFLTTNYSIHISKNQNQKLEMRSNINYTQVMNILTTMVNNYHKENTSDNVSKHRSLVCKIMLIWNICDLASVRLWTSVKGWCSVVTAHLRHIFIHVHACGVSASVLTTQLRRPYFLPEITLPANLSSHACDGSKSTTKS